MSIYKILRETATEEENFELVAQMEICINENEIIFKTGEDMDLFVEGQHPDFKVKYTKGRTYGLNITPKRDQFGKELPHGSRVKFEKGKRELGTRSIDFEKDDKGNSTAIVSIYKNQSKKKDKFNEDLNLEKDHIDAGYSFIAGQTDSVKRFIDGDDDFNTFLQSVKDYDGKSDNEKKLLAKSIKKIK